MRASTRWGLAVALILLALQAGAADRTPPTLGPRLLYYPLACNDARGCRIDCFQDGRGVITALDTIPGDTVYLVVNSGIADDITPRWIELRSEDSTRSRTILLGRGTVCDLQAFLIQPLESP